MFCVLLIGYSGGRRHFWCRGWAKTFALDPSAFVAALKLGPLSKWTLHGAQLQMKRGLCTNMEQPLGGLGGRRARNGRIGSLPMAGRRAKYGLLLLVGGSWNIRNGGRAASYSAPSRAASFARRRRPSGLAGGRLLGVTFSRARGSSRLPPSLPPSLPAGLASGARGAPLKPGGC